MAPTDEIKPNHQTTMHKYQASHHVNGTTDILATCYSCGKESLITVDTADYLNWTRGALIQDVFNYRTPAERELLISGFCGDCFDRLVADEQ